jgi:nucleoside-diphosphate-sugar epimerase
MSAETVLMTGGSGFIGLDLARALAEEGHRIVVFDLKEPPDRFLPDGSMTFVRGDVANFSEVLNAVRDFKPDGIIHLAAILSEPSEKSPWTSISVNALGTYHVLEAARLFAAKKVLFSSSMAVYINDRSKADVVSEETAQRPPFIYGITKVFCELLALYYHRKFGVDTRGIRLPVLIGPHVESPGFGQYNSLMVEAAVRGAPIEVSVPADNAIPILYVKDAVRGLRMLYHAAEEKLVARIYNVGQIMPPFSTGDLARLLQSYYPGARITFNPDPLATEVNRSTPGRITCDEARDEWGWHVAYSLEDMVKDLIATFSAGKGG